MKCPHCGSDNPAGASTCAACGALLSPGQDPQAMKAVTTGGLVFGKKARQARINEVVDPSAIVDTRVYNGIIGGMVLWGFLVNWLLCEKVGSIARFAPNVSPIAFLIGYLVLVFGGVILTNKTKNPGLAFLGYNMVVVPFGVIIATMVEAYGGISSSVVTLAFLYTLLSAAAMVATVIVFPQWFEKLGGALGAVLIGLILCEVVLLLFHVNQIVTCWIAAGLFSLYLGYDIYRSQQYPKTVTNAIRSSLDIYMDLANLFIRLLEILGKKND